MTHAPAPKVDGWLPIERAPKDGTDVLVWVDKNRGCVLAAWFKEWRYDRFHPTSKDCWVMAGGHVCFPTHWQPLPSPPKEDGRDNSGDPETVGAFAIGQRVLKDRGDYSFEGEVVAVFSKRNDGPLRYVVETDEGLCHIFNHAQLRSWGTSNDSGVSAHNARILEQMQGVPSQPATPESMADPRNPVRRNDNEELSEEMRDVIEDVKRDIREAFKDTEKVAAEVVPKPAPSPDKDHGGLVERARGYANDPMWTDHCEVAKAVMSEMADAIEELVGERDEAREAHKTRVDLDYDSALRKIDLLKAENERLLLALTPFANLADQFDDPPNDLTSHCPIRADGNSDDRTATIGDLRRARTAFQRKAEGA